MVTLTLLGREVTVQRAGLHDARERDKGSGWALVLLSGTLLMAGCEFRPTGDSIIIACGVAGLILAGNATNLTWQWRPLIRDMDRDIDKDLCKQYWFTEWKPLRKIWPSPTLSREWSTQYGDREETTIVSNLGQTMHCCHIQGLYLETGGDACRVEIITRIGDVIVLLEPGQQHNLTRFPDMFDCFVKVMPMSSISDVHIKLQFPILFPSPAFTPEDVQRFHHSRQMEKASQTRVFKEELVRRAWSPRHFMHCLDHHELREMDELFSD